MSKRFLREAEVVSISEWMSRDGKRYMLRHMDSGAIRWRTAAMNRLQAAIHVLLLFYGQRRRSEVKGLVFSRDTRIKRRGGRTSYEYRILRDKAGRMTGQYIDVPEWVYRRLAELVVEHHLENHPLFLYNKKTLNDIWAEALSAVVIDDGRTLLDVDSREVRTCSRCDWSLRYRGQNHCWRKPYLEAVEEADRRCIPRPTPREVQANPSARSRYSPRVPLEVCRHLGKVELQRRYTFTPHSLRRSGSMWYYDLCCERGVPEEEAFSRAQRRGGWLSERVFDTYYADQERKRDRILDTSSELVGAPMPQELQEWQPHENMLSYTVTWAEVL